MEIQNSLATELTLCQAWAHPLNVQLSTSQKLKVIDANGVKAARERNDRLLLKRPMQAIVVDELLAIDRQTASVVGLEIERVSSVCGNPNLPLKHKAKLVASACGCQSDV